MTLHWIHTSDVHGHLDALQGVENHVNELRNKVGAANVVLSDGGDCLQGSPLVYYHNYIDTDSPHIVAETMNRMQYDCVAVGNHDIEVGHSVYDRAFPQMNFPVLCANIKDYFTPYYIMEKGGLRIAILSLITPETTNWISPSQYSGMVFLDVKECARYWIDYIKVHEQIDMLVGLFHIGWNDVKPLIEEIQDFDFVLYGHDHHARIERVGRTICAAPSSQATSFIHIQVTSASSQHQIDAQIIQNHSQSVSTISPPWGGIVRFATLSKKELEGASIDCDLNEFDSYFGPSSFLTLTHQLQLSSTGAQISLAAPISYDAFIPRGPLTNLDVFKLYDRDSQLYTMQFTLEEIKGVLEYSYSLWTNVMTSPDDHALLLDYVLDNGTRLGLKNFTINFLSAYGINYTVDLTKPYGQKITIKPNNLITSQPHDLIKVCLNSYHANGGGDVLVKGTGLTHSQLLDRVIKVEPHDLRQCLANEIQKRGNIHLSNINNWHFIPESWAQPALERDRTILAL